MLCTIVKLIFFLSLKHIHTHFSTKNLYNASLMEIIYDYDTHKFLNVQLCITF